MQHAKHNAIRIAAWLLINAALWSLFVFKVSLPETLLGLGSTLLATVAVAYAAHTAEVCFNPPFKKVLEAWRIPAYLLTGTQQTLAAIARQLFTKKGADTYIAAVPYRYNDDTPEHAALRALVVMYTTATPNFLILATLTEERLLLFHQIQKAAILPMTKNLGVSLPPSAGGHA